MSRPRAPLRESPVGYSPKASSSRRRLLHKLAIETRRCQREIGRKGINGVLKRLESIERKLKEISG